MKCLKCNSDNPDDNIYCGKCGAPLKPSEDTTGPQTETLETHKEELTRGSTFARRYEIIEKLGKGGMGKVYRVYDKKIKGEVALKLIKPEISAERKTIERFRNELKLAREIAHRNVCRMYDLNEEKGTHYITMEYVAGQDLKSMIKMSGQLSTRTAVKISKQLCEGLAEAHRLGVVHRDLKPSNIMIDREGHARIMDFGIARSLKTKGITGEGVMIGTPEYMSPEQAEGKELDHRSDIYSFGIVLYEMVTGIVPFKGDTPLSVALMHKIEMPKDPRELNALIPEELSRLILNCVEKNKEDRYQNSEELLADLSRIEKEILTTEIHLPPSILEVERRIVKTGEKRSKILVVDDKPVNVELLEAMLSSQYDVITAYDGHEALEKAIRELPDLILLDIMLPGMNGYEVCRQLKEREETKIIPIVMVTALKEKEERIIALEAGADDFLTKPVDRAELLARVKSLLRIKHFYNELIRMNKTLELRVSQQVEQIQKLNRLKQYFSPRLAEKLISDESLYRTRRKELSIFFTEICNFTSFCETMEPEELLGMLDTYFSEMTEAIFRWGGTVGKFLGNGIMGFFGDPEECPDHAELAVKMALEMKSRVKKLNEENPLWRTYPLSVGTGVHTGYVTIGNIGTDVHRDYTVIGKSVHVAAYLVREAKPGQVLVSDKTYSIVADSIRAKKIGKLTIEGIEKAVSIYEVSGLALNTDR